MQEARRAVKCLRLIGSWLIAAQGALAAGTDPDPARTRAYIEHAWSTLTRSMADCSALRDPKVATHPVLYLPAKFPRPAGLAEVSERCHLDGEYSCVVAFGKKWKRVAAGALGKLGIPRPDHDQGEYDG